MTDFICSNSELGSAVTLTHDNTFAVIYVDDTNFEEDGEGFGLE